MFVPLVLEMAVVPMIQFATVAFPTALVTVNVGAVIVVLPPFVPCGKEVAPPV
jgi:hypothetical protein